MITIRLQLKIGLKSDLIDFKSLKLDYNLKCHRKKD